VARRSPDALFAPWQALSAEQRIAWRGMLTAHRRIVGALEAELERQTGWSLVAFDVLLTLSQARERRMQMYALAEAVGLSRSGLSRLVDRLEAAGLVVRHRGDPDPRQRFACLTVAGARALATMIEVHVAGIDERFFAELSATQTGQLAAIWRRLLRADARARHQLEDAAGDR
jgi:DNA-binding MarR family transcriptional regulator